MARTNSPAITVSLPWLALDHAVPCGLLINELLSNSLKYAFPDERCGNIGVALEAATPDTYRLRVWDTGIGLPEGAESSRSSTLGMRLVQSLSRQLRGTLKITRTEGTVIAVTFPA